MQKLSIPLPLHSKARRKPASRHRVPRRQSTDSTETEPEPEEEEETEEVSTEDSSDEYTYETISKEVKSKAFRILNGGLYIAAGIIAVINVFIVIFAGWQDNLVLYFTVAGYDYINPKCTIIFFGFLLAGFLVSSSLAWRFAHPRRLYRWNVISYSALALLASSICLCLWFVLIFPVTNDLSSKMAETLRHSYRGEYSADIYSVSWNFIQFNHQTCGASGPGDWLQSHWFEEFGFFEPVFCCSGIEDVHLREYILTMSYTLEDKVKRHRYECHWMSRRGRKAKTTTATSSTTPSIELNETKEEPVSSDSSDSGIAERTETTSTTVTSTTSETSQLHRSTKFKSLPRFEIDPKHNGFQTAYWMYHDDPLGSTSAHYVQPKLDANNRNKKLSWYEADEYCKYYYSYSFPSDDMEQHPPGLAVGFSPSELMMVYGAFGNNIWIFPYLGMKRQVGPNGPEVTIPAYPNISAPVDSLAWGYWDPNIRKSTGHRNGCLVLSNGYRQTCTDYGTYRLKNYICAFYGIVAPDDSTPTTLKYIHRVYYETKISPHLLARYFPVYKQATFTEAAKNCKTFFGENWFLAFGVNKKEMLFLHDIAKLAEFPGKYIHLGIVREYDGVFVTESDIVVKGSKNKGYLEYGIISHFWSDNYPKRNSECDKNSYLMLYGKPLERREECSSTINTPHEFICAKYQIIPEDPFWVKPEHIEVPTHYPDGRRVFRPDLSIGYKKMKDLNDPQFDMIFEWSSAFHDLKAVYFVSEAISPNVWTKAHANCMNWIKKAQPELAASSKEYGLPVGFTADELELISSLDQFKGKDFTTHLQFTTTNLPLDVLNNKEFDLRGLIYFPMYDGSFNGQPYEAGFLQEEKENSREKFGCFGQNLRHFCEGTETEFLCANYTFKEDGFDTKMKREKIPSIMYEFFVSDQIHVEYWVILNPKLNYGDATHHCAYVYGPGFTLPIGFNEKELKFISSILKESGISNKWIHLGYERESSHRIGNTQIYDVKFREMWLKKTRKSDEYYGCLRRVKESLGLDYCRTGKQPYVCALYLRNPYQGADAGGMSVEFEAGAQKEDTGTPGIAREVPLDEDRDIREKPANERGSLDVVRSTLLGFTLPLTYLLLSNVVLILFILVTSILLYVVKI